jgi:hypothetical protein
MYPRILWQLVADPLGSAEHTFGTTDLKGSHYTSLLDTRPFLLLVIFPFLFLLLLRRLFLLLLFLF